MRRQITKLLADCANDRDGDLLRGRNLAAYVEKLLSQAELLAWHRDGELGALVAFYANDPEGELAFITMIAVSPGYRGKGLGRDLLASSLSIMSARGFRKCRLEVAPENVRAVGLYLSLGFTEVSRSEQALVLEVTLRTASLVSGR